MRQYLDAVREVLDKGTRKENRTGVDTLSTFNINYECDLRDGFPLLTTKKINWKNIVVEVLWFLSGDPHIGILKKHKCKFWDPWANEAGEVPSAYGNFWRNFPVHGKYVLEERNGVITQADCLGFNDQIAWAVEELRRNPMSRRIVVSAWAPGNAQTSKLPPCHITWVLNVQNLNTRVLCSTCGGMNSEEYGPIDANVACPSCDGMGFYRINKPHLCLHLTQRSCDIALGVPYNIATYALLLHLISRFTEIPVGIFAHTLVDAHAYTCKPDGSMAEYDHVPGLREQLKRPTRSLPQLSLKGLWELGDISKLLEMNTDEVMAHFELQNYNPEPAIKFKVAV